MIEPYRTLAVPVPGGELHVGLWGEGPLTIVAAHGITANHRSWQAVARELPDTATLVAPDLRGRGRSAALPAPYGMRAHADDLLRVLDHLGAERAVLAGHSMGAYVATVAATGAPHRWSQVVLVDGGIALPVPDEVDPEQMLAMVLGPSLARLEMTFESVDAYHDFWRSHPAFGDPGAWTEDVEAFLDHDLDGAPPELRSSASIEAVRLDGAELLVDRGVRTASERLTVPTTLLRAPRGLLNQSPGLLPDELVAPLRGDWAISTEVLVPDTNHYSILVAANGARTVAHHLVAAAPVSRS